MPAGKRSTGRNNPTTPGSSRPGEERTSTAAGSSKSVLARTAARMRSQSLSRISMIAANPHAQTARIAMETQSRAPCGDGAGGRAPENGWLICAILKEIAGAAIRAATFWAAGAHSRWLPRLISSEKGTKNLSEALSHKQ